MSWLRPGSNTDALDQARMQAQVADRQREIADHLEHEQLLDEVPRVSPWARLRRFLRSPRSP